MQGSLSNRAWGRSWGIPIHQCGMGMLWVGSEHGESGLVVGGHPSTGAHEYVVVGPKTWGACVWGTWQRMVEGGGT